MRKVLIFGILVLLIAVSWYLLYPLFNVIELDETSPLDLQINDAKDTMDADTKAKFNRQMEAMKDQVVEITEPMPGPLVVAQGEFKPRAHDVRGRALWIDDNGRSTLRFEDFETVNGPKLHIYLFSSLESDDYIDLGEIKATKGNVNYAIPSDVDLSVYNKAAVWCVPFRVLFSYAELK